MIDDATIVIGADGIVLAAEGDLPPNLIDVALTDCGNLPKAVRDAGSALLDELQHSPRRLLTACVALDGNDRQLKLVAVEALPVRRTPVDLRSLLTSKLAVISSQALAADVVFNVTVADDLPATVLVDADKLAWAVTTLVGNALRYVQSGPRRSPRGTVDVRATFDRTSSRVVIEVQDDGPGIPVETVARLFKHDGLNVRGSGLSLLLMSDILGAHGGRLDVHSDMAPTTHGTTVRLVFPVA